MSRYTGPVKKKLRRFGLIATEEVQKNYRTQARTTRPKRKSEFGIRLEEKQKIKFIYGVTERQFARYIKIAFHTKGQTGVRLLQLLETRLDRVLFLSGLVTTSRMARQFVGHGHVLVNDKKVTIPSYGLKKDDVITLKPKTLENVQVLKQFKEEKKDLPTWLKKKGPVIKVDRIPEREDIDQTLNEQLVVEYYSR